MFCTVGRELGQEDSNKDETDESHKKLTLQELREKNAELRQVCEELTRELAGALQERINLRAKLLLLTWSFSFLFCAWDLKCSTEIDDRSRSRIFLWKKRNLRDFFLFYNLLCVDDEYHLRNRASWIIALLYLLLIYFSCSFVKSRTHQYCNLFIAKTRISFHLKLNSLSIVCFKSLFSLYLLLVCFLHIP